MRFKDNVGIVIWYNSQKLLKVYHNLTYYVMFLFVSKFIFSTSTTKIFMTSGGRLDFSAFFSFSRVQKTPCSLSIFNCICSNSTRLQLLVLQIEKTGHCVYINFRLDYNKKARPNARNISTQHIIALLRTFGHPVIPFFFLQHIAARCPKLYTTCYMYNNVAIYK